MNVHARIDNFKRNLNAPDSEFGVRSAAAIFVVIVLVFGGIAAAYGVIAAIFWAANHATYLFIPVVVLAALFIVHMATTNPKGTK